MTDFLTGSPPSQPQGDAHFVAGLLQATLTARKVVAMVSLAWDGPQLRVYSCSLGLGEEPERVERLAGALALAAGAESCRISRAPGRLLIELAKPESERQTLKASQLDKLPPPSPMAVALGISSGGKVAWLNLADDRSPHLLIAGTTGSGKTIALHWLLYRLIKQSEPQELRLIAMDPKRTELTPFERVPHLLHLAHHPLDVARLLAWATGELERRASRGYASPKLLIVVEEVADLLAANPELAQPLARIAQVGRGLGLHLIATSQQPGVASLGKSLVNFPARLLGRVASQTLVYAAAGRAQTAAHELLGRGDMLLLAAGSTTRLQLPLVGGRELGTLPRLAQPNTLEGSLPTLAQFADLRRDARGGNGRRNLSPQEYAAIDEALDEGATQTDIRERFSIGQGRAARIANSYREAGG